MKTVGIVSLSSGTIGEDFVKHEVEIGTRRDLVLYRIETSKNDLKSGASAPDFVVSYVV